jgi:hypothetical protein
MNEQVPEIQFPYVKLTLFTDMRTIDAEGWTHMPLAIESWPPGMNVRLLLEQAAASFDDKEGVEPDGHG